MTKTATAFPICFRWPCIVMHFLRRHDQVCVRGPGSCRTERTYTHCSIVLSSWHTTCSSMLVYMHCSSGWWFIAWLFLLQIVFTGSNDLELFFKSLVDKHGHFLTNPCLETRFLLSTPVEYLKSRVTMETLYYGDNYLKLVAPIGIRTQEPLNINRPPLRSRNR